MKKKSFGLGALFSAVAVAAFYSDRYVNYSDSLLSIGFGFLVFLILNFVALLVVYEIGNAIERKVKSETAAWVSLIAFIVVAFILCLIYKK